MQFARQRQGVRWILLLLAMHGALLAFLAANQSPVFDEVAHLPAGISHWFSGDMSLYCANPPLVRMLAAMPVLPVVTHAWLPKRAVPGNRSEFEIGRVFIQEHGQKTFDFFTWARWACIPLSLVGAAVCFLWARDLYGTASGYWAAAMWCFCPNILANASLITPDLGATALGVAAAYCFWKWLRKPQMERALLAGCVLGLAELTKLTWVMLFALWPALWCFWRLTTAGVGDRRETMRQASQLAAIVGTALLVLNAGYGFSGTGTRLGEFQFVSKKFAGDEAGPPQARWGNRFAGTALHNVPVPLPKDYVLGVDIVAEAFEMHREGYLRGEFSNEGWWYYYFYVLAVKLPLGTWGMLGLAFAWACRRRTANSDWRDAAVLLAPLVVLLAVAALKTGINRHGRYILPVFPFAFIGISQIAQAVPRRQWTFAVPAAGCLTWMIGSSLVVYPYSGSYFNELAGGPANGHAHLICSNIDWGQDLPSLNRWLDEHPEAAPLNLAFYGGFDPAITGLAYELPPRGPTRRRLEDRREQDTTILGPVPGWHAVSVHLLRGSQGTVPNGRGKRERAEPHDFSYFLNFEPVARAGYSINIYHISREQANGVRTRLGLPLL